MVSRLALVLLVASWSSMGLAQVQAEADTSGPRLLTVDRDSATLRTVDPETAETLSRLELTYEDKDVTIEGATGLALHPDTGELFSILKTDEPGGRRLATIDAETGETTEIGDTEENFAGIAFHSDGRLFGVTGDGSKTPETLFEIDTKDATITLICELGNGTDGETIGFSPDTGLLYHASGLDGGEPGDFIVESIDDLEDDPCSVTDIELPDDLDFTESTALAWSDTDGHFFWAQGYDKVSMLFTLTVDGEVESLEATDHLIKGLVFMPGDEDVFRRGDVDNSGTTSGLPDGLYLLRWEFIEGPAPPCLAAADVDNSGGVSALPDALNLLRWAFVDGDAPESPGPTTCGTDPEADEISCDDPSACD